MTLTCLFLALEHVVAVAGLLKLVQQHVLDLGVELAEVAHEALVRVFELLRVSLLARVREHCVVRVGGVLAAELDAARGERDGPGGVGRARVVDDIVGLLDVALGEALLALLEGREGRLVEHHAAQVAVVQGLQRVRAVDVDLGRALPVLLVSHARVASGAYRQRVRLRFHPNRVVDLFILGVDLEDVETEGDHGHRGERLRVGEVLLAGQGYLRLELLLRMLDQLRDLRQLPHLLQRPRPPIRQLTRHVVQPLHSY